MRGGRKANTGRKKGEVISKMPKVEFDMDAIKEIKKKEKKGLWKTSESIIQGKEVKPIKSKPSRSN